MNKKDAIYKIYYKLAGLRKYQIAGVYPKEMWAAEYIVENKISDKWDIYEFLDGDNFWNYHIIFCLANPCLK